MSQPTPPSSESSAPALDGAAGVAWLVSFVGDDPQRRREALGPVAEIAAQNNDRAALAALIQAGASPSAALRVALGKDDPELWSMLAPTALLGAKGLCERSLNSALVECAKKQAPACFEAAARFALIHRKPPEAAQALAPEASEGMDEFDDEPSGRLDMAAISARWFAKELWTALANLKAPQSQRMAQAAQTLGMGFERRWDLRLPFGEGVPGVPLDDSPLQVAVRHGNVELVQTLLDMGAPVGRAALAASVEAKNLDLCALLVAHAGPDGAAEGRTRSPLESAILLSQLPMVRLLLSAGADPNAISETRQTMLQVFVGSTPLLKNGPPSSLDICAALLAAGADPTLSFEGPCALKELETSRRTDERVEIFEMMRDFVARRELVSELRQNSREPSHALSPAAARL